MNRFGTSMARRLALAGTTALLCAGLGTAWAAEPAPAAQDGPREAMAQHAQRHVQEHLDGLAARLEIKASQEPAWQSFSAAFRELMTPRPRLARDAKPGSGPDAATMAREQAERAAARAQHLARLADATSQLEQVLGPEQRLVLDEAARRFHEHYAHAGMMRGEGHGGPHCDPAHRFEREHDGAPMMHGPQRGDAEGPPDPAS
jgi:hypothetical protein